jgi:hypothetical protein
MGKNAVSSIYQKILSANQVHTFTNWNDYFEIFPQGEKSWDVALNNPKRKVKELAIDNHFNRKFLNRKKGLQGFQAKIFRTSDFELQDKFIDCIIFDNQVATIQLEQQSIQGILINSPSTAQSLKAVHKALWNKC